MDRGKGERTSSSFCARCTFARATSWVCSAFWRFLSVEYSVFSVLLRIFSALTVFCKDEINTQSIYNSIVADLVRLGFRLLGMREVVDDVLEISLFPLGLFYDFLLDPFEEVGVGRGGGCGSGDGG